MQKGAGVNCPFVKLLHLYLIQAIICRTMY